MLGQLDTTALEQQLHEAQQTLADASLTLANGLAGTKSTTGGSGTTARKCRRSPVSRLAHRPHRARAPIRSSPPPEQAVLDGQSSGRRRDDDGIDRARQRDSSVCAPPSSDPSAGDPQPDPDTCTTALQAVLDAQKAVQTAQNQLAAASIAYDDLLAERGLRHRRPRPSTRRRPHPATASAGSRLDGRGSACRVVEGNTPSATGGSGRHEHGAVVRRTSSRIRRPSTPRRPRSPPRSRRSTRRRSPRRSPGTVVAVTLTVGESVDDPTQPERHDPGAVRLRGDHHHRRRQDQHGEGRPAGHRHTGLDRTRRSPGRSPRSRSRRCRRRRPRPTA